VVWAGCDRRVARDTGDVTQVDNLSPTHPGSRGIRRLVGGRVGAEAVKVLAIPGDLGPLNADQTVLKIARRAPTPSDWERLSSSSKMSQGRPHRLTFPMKS
jgi:hypothetical protein